MTSTRAIQVLAAHAVVLALTAAGCDKDQVPIVASATDKAYGRAELLAAIEVYGAGEATPARYREMAVAVATLSRGFDEVVAQEAERHLVFLAAALLDDAYEAPLDAQRDALATTVWPTALAVQPRADETPAAYTERICGAELALECKYVVSEYRSLVLAALVWDRLESRGQEALVQCKVCDGPRWREQLATLETRKRDMGARAKQHEDLAAPTHWLVAGDHAGAWPDAPIPIAVVDGAGESTLDDTPIPAGGWVDTLRASRGDDAVLGLRVPGATLVSELRAIVADAGRAGFTDVALLAHEPAFPFAPRAYRLATQRRAGRPVRVRDVDRAQVLVQGLDAAAAAGAERMTF